MHIGVYLCDHFTGKEQNARGKAVVQIYVQVQSQACVCPFRATGSRGDSSARRVLRGIECGPPAWKACNPYWRDQHDRITGAF